MEIHGALRRLYEKANHSIDCDFHNNFSSRHTNLVDISNLQPPPSIYLFYDCLRESACLVEFSCYRSDIYDRDNFIVVLNKPDINQEVKVPSIAYGDTWFLKLFI